jgi:hypothetical protein
MTQRIYKPLSVTFFCLVFFHAIAQPNARHLEKIVWDPFRKTLIVYGGSEQIPGGWVEAKDMYEWKDSSWKKISANVPGGRRGHSLVYDRDRKMTLVMGGVTEVKAGDSVLFDTWGWNGKTWELVNSNCPVKDPHAVYDPAAKRMLIYGDANNLSRSWVGGDAQSFELWEFKANVWKKISSEGPAPDGPYQVAFNTKTGSVIILEWEEDDKPIVWAWVNESWRKNDCVSNCPSIRNRYAMAYHAKDNSLYLFGGRDNAKKFKNDFWKYDGKEWVSVSAANTPTPRASLHFTSAGDRLFLYGGALEGGKLSNELWEWRNGFWTLMK